MKRIIGTVASFMAINVGLNAGKWLWNEVLESKMNNLKDHLSKKFKRNEEAR